MDGIPEGISPQKEATKRECVPDSIPHSTRLFPDVHTFRCKGCSTSPWIRTIDGFNAPDSLAEDASIGIHDIAEVRHIEAWGIIDGGDNDSEVFDRRSVSASTDCPAIVLRDHTKRSIP